MKFKSYSGNYSKFLYLFAILLILLYYLPFFIYGEDSYIRVHDNLDSNVVWFQLIIKNKAIFSPAKLIPQQMNGLYAFSLRPEYEPSIIFFQLSGPYWGYVVSKVFASLVGLLGMFLLLKDHIFKQEHNSALMIGIASVFFALLPHWGFTMAVTGIPLFIWSFLNLISGHSIKKSLIMLAIASIITSFFFSGLYLMLIAVLGFIYDTLKNKKINKNIFGALVMAGSIYALQIIPIIWGYITLKTGHRSNFSLPPAQIDLLSLIKQWLIGAHLHINSLSWYLFLYSLFVIIAGTFIHKKITQNIKKIVLFLAIVFLIIFIVILKEKFLYAFPVQMDRFYVLLPVIWTILFALMLREFYVWFVLSKIKLVKFVVLLLGISLVILQAKLVITYHPFKLYTTNEIYNPYPTYKEYYAEASFAEIKRKLPSPVKEYKVISVGFDPAITLFNGFYTLDGYAVFYSGKYKNLFRKIIEKELAKSPSLKQYFDNWGSRCYAFSAEIYDNKMQGKNLFSPKPTLRKLNRLDFNYNLLKKLQCKYIISVVAINNPSLKLLFTRKDRYWQNFYVYEIL